MADYFYRPTARVPLLLLRLGLLLLLYIVLRALFLISNFHYFNHEAAGEILRAFLVGVRFDISAICLINAPFIFFSLLPGPLWERNWYQRALKFLFFFSNLPFLIMNVVDVEYFKFTGQRSTSTLLDMKADLGSQLGQLTFHYWYLAAAGVLLMAGFYYLIPERAFGRAEKASPARWIRDSLAMIAVVALVVLGVRGGLQGKVISTVQADVFDGLNLSHLALNTSFTLIHSRPGCDSRTLPAHRFFSDAELEKQLAAPRPQRLNTAERLDNVVIIIVESLSAQYTGMGDPKRGYTPFLDELGKKGILFKNHFADARRSIDAPPAILAGLPHLVDETFYCAQQKRLVGIGSLLKERGYTTSFFHGGRNGTMYFDVFSKRMGFDRYYGLNEYPNPEDSDGIWGIYDEPFLQFVDRELTRYKEPFASVVFTLSSHNPYKIPAQYAGVFPKGELPILESVGYVDYSLKKFFETAEKMPWYKHTLFIITGDHTAAPRTTYRHLIEAYRVPLILFHPGGLPKVDTEKVVQHVDIGASILDFLGIGGARFLDFGHSIFDSAYPGLAFSQLNGEYWIAGKKHFLEYRLRGASKLFDLASLEPRVEPEVQKRLEAKLQAYIQKFNHNLAGDKLYD
jgi:phosphoglycerol transferase MdoB-like AlkP superfamily enzyme